MIELPGHESGGDAIGILGAGVLRRGLSRRVGQSWISRHARREDMRELINAKAKLREPFRPFAPAVLEERAGEYFDLPGPSPFMLFTAPVRASIKGIIPAVVHIDGSARVQTVARDSNP